jgi:hypothetical protein
MNIGFSSLKTVALSTLVVGLSACGLKNSATGTVQLQMTNAASLNFSNFDLSNKLVGPFALNSLSPTKFEMKVLSAYVVEDVDPTTQNNVGQVGMVWLHEDCTDINSCTPADVAFSDLTDPTAFNLKLSSQAKAIATGTYKYARLEFCQGSAGVDNVQITYTDPDTTLPVVITKQYGGCGVTSVALATGVTVAEGGTVKIALTYNLNDGEVYWADGSSTCTKAAACLGGIELTPSIVE